MTVLRGEPTVVRTHTGPRRAHRHVLRWVRRSPTLGQPTPCVKQGINQRSGTVTLGSLTLTVPTGVIHADVRLRVHLMRPPLRGRAVLQRRLADLLPAVRGSPAQGVQRRRCRLQGLRLLPHRLPQRRLLGHAARRGDSGSTATATKTETSAGSNGSGAAKGSGSKTSDSKRFGQHVLQAGLGRLRHDRLRTTRTGDGPTRTTGAGHRRPVGTGGRPQHRPGRPTIHSPPHRAPDGAGRR